VEKLGVHRPENPTSMPAPPPQFIQSYIERECARRVFWLTHLMDVKSSIYFGTFLPPKENELLLRLPVDETSFELALHSTLPGEFPSSIVNSNSRLISLGRIFIFARPSYPVCIRIRSLDSCDFHLFESRENVGGIRRYVSRLHTRKSFDSWPQK
jgi:hypothetical protein